jgi:predicted lipid carrier protein YhbT
MIRLQVTDAGVTLTMRVTPLGFAPSASANPDVTLTARACDFLALALRREDSDTLFFSRRLVIEGDTELGLLIKNSLDALEFKPVLPTPRNVLRMLRSRLP